MINAYYYISDTLVDLWFDDLNTAINQLTSLYMAVTTNMPEYVFISYDLYADMLKAISYNASFAPEGHNIVSYYTVLGNVTIKPVSRNKKHFIYVGTEQGYLNSLLDETFERDVLGEEL